MTKLGLFIDFIGFSMLFWQSYVRSGRDVKNGGGFATDNDTEQKQIEKALKWISNELIRQTLAKFWQTMAFGLITLGILLQLFHFK